MTVKLKPFRTVPADEKEWARWMSDQDLGSETDTTLIESNITALQADVAGIWTRLSKENDETRNSTTTLAADSDLQFLMEANTVYAGRMVVFFDTGAAPDFKFEFSGPSSPTAVRINGEHIAPGDAAFTEFNDEAYNVTGTPIGSGTVGGCVKADFLVQNASNAGTFSFDWAQNTSDAGDTTVLAGSYLEYFVI
jgi:hypothetical protein